VEEGYILEYLHKHPGWITGFTEGNFTFMISKNNKYKTGYLVTAIFQISLHKRDEALLKAIKAYFGVGNLYLNRDGIEFKVQSIKDPPRITP
jgi:hypothetical protein